MMLLCFFHNPNISITMGTDCDDSDDMIHQCWDCDSEGEFYVHQSPAIKPDLYVDPVTGNVNKLH